MSTRKTLPANPPFVLERVGPKASEEVRTHSKKESLAHQEAPASTRNTRPSSALGSQSKILKFILHHFDVFLERLETSEEDFRSKSEIDQKLREIGLDIKHARLMFRDSVKQLLAHSNLTTRAIANLDLISLESSAFEPFADQGEIKEAYERSIKEVRWPLYDINTRLSDLKNSRSRREQFESCAKLKSLSRHLVVAVEELTRLIASFEAIRSSQSISKTANVLVPPNLQQNIQKTRMIAAELSESLDLMFCNKHDHHRVIHLPLKWANAHENVSKELCHGLIVRQLLLDFEHKDQRVTAMLYMQPQGVGGPPQAIPMDKPICEYDWQDAPWYPFQTAESSFNGWLHVKLVSSSSQTKVLTLWDTLSGELRSSLDIPQIITVALHLAESFLQIHSTPWLSNLLQKKNVILSETSGILLDVSPGSTTFSANEENEEVRVSDTQTLVIRLLELSAGKCVEHVPHRAMSVTEPVANVSKSFLDYLTALKMSRRPSSFGPRYGELVKWCLTFDNERMKSGPQESEFWENVILRFQKMLQQLSI